MRRIIDALHGGPPLIDLDHQALYLRQRLCCKAARAERAFSTEMASQNYPVTGMIALMRSWTTDGNLQSRKMCGSEPISVICLVVPERSGAIYYRHV